MSFLGWEHTYVFPAITWRLRDAFQSMGNSGSVSLISTGALSNRPPNCHKAPHTSVLRGSEGGELTVLWRELHNVPHPSWWMFCFGALATLSIWPGGDFPVSTYTSEGSTVLFF
jgi:hypothetical protein